MLRGGGANIVAKTGRSDAEARRIAGRAAIRRRRLVTPEEVADAVLWLASPGASADHRPGDRRRRTAKCMSGFRRLA